MNHVRENRAADLDEFERLLLGFDVDETGDPQGVCDADAHDEATDRAETSQPSDLLLSPPPRSRAWSKRLLPVGIGLVASLGCALIGGGLLLNAPLSAASGSGQNVSASHIEAPISAAQAGVDSDAEVVGELERTTESPSMARGAKVPADPVWVAEVSRASGVPERALAAYASAALTIGRERPWCGLGWNTLAAIGHVESGHGSIDGAQIDASGVVSPRILGVRLDGSRFDAVVDTDGGELDGDAQWDRAVGPMQFLPQTWASYARDGNGDGLKQVDQMDDAALSAAEMLCSVGGDLSVPSNWVAAIYTYNPSVDYNNEVAEAADYYAGFSQ